MPRLIEEKITHDTRETHHPAPVVLPTRTMAKVSDRMRLIRQGDHRELAVLEAAVKKGKGVRPWRLSTENPNLFYAARLMREEEDRQKQKIMYAAGMYIDEDQAPIAGSGNNRSSNTSKDNGSTTGGGNGIAADSGSAGSEQPQLQHQREENMSDAPVSPPNERDGDFMDTATGSQTEVDGAVVDGGHNDAALGEASTSSNHACPDRDRKDEGNADGEGEVHGLDIENDVRKRVLDLVGARALDGLRSTFQEASGRLGKDAFIEALLCTVYENGGGGIDDTPGDGENDAPGTTRTASTFGSEAAKRKRLRSPDPPAVNVCAGSSGGGDSCPAGAGAAPVAVQADDTSSSHQIAERPPGHYHHDHSEKQSPFPAGSSSGSVSRCLPSAGGGGDGDGDDDGGGRAAEARPKRLESAPRHLVSLYGRLFEFVSLQHDDWTTWEELSNFLLFDGESQGGQGGPRQYMAAGSVHINKVLGLESAIVFKVSRAGQDLDVAALLIRNSPTFMVVSLDGLTSSAAAPVRVKGHAGQALAMAFAEPFNVLVTSGEKDRAVRCWDVLLKPSLDVVASKRQAKAPEPQVMLKWLRSTSEGVHPAHSNSGSGGDSESDVVDVLDVLVSGGVGGTVIIWQLTMKHLVILHSLPGHTGAVTSACMLPHPEVIVTGALDANIRMWAHKTYQCKRVMKGHSRGVVTIEYSPSQRIIVSAGFDHDILVWSPVAGQVICRLVGHVCSLVAARVSAFSSDVVSMSMDGIIKVWDSANFKCVQTIHSSNCHQKSSSGGGRAGRGASGNAGGEEGGGRRMQMGKAGQDGGNKNGRKGSSASGASVGGGGAATFADFFLFEGETSRLLVCRGTELDFYDNGRAGEKDVTDSNQTTDVMYHPQTGTFASVASTGIKLWDARTGRLTRTYGVPPQPTKRSSGGRWMKPRGVGASALLSGERVRFSSVIVGGSLVASRRTEEITSACIDSRGHQIVMGFNTGRVTCARYLTGRVVGHLDFHPGEVTDVAGVWTDGSGALVLTASDATASLQKMALDEAEPRRTIAVLDPRLEVIRMEASNQVLHGTVEDSTSAVKQLMVGAKILRAKKTFLTTLDSIRGRSYGGGGGGGGDDDPVRSVRAVSREEAAATSSGKAEELRSPRPAQATAAAAATTEYVPTPPPGQKPRPSSSLFNEKFARRFLRRNGGGGGQDTTKARTRGGDDGDGGNGNDGVGGAQGKGQEHGGKCQREEPSMGSESHGGTHITSVAVSHMYQLAATGSLNGSVIVWDVQKGPSTCGLATLEAHNGYQVNGICFLEPHAALATCNLEGRIAVWRMGPAPDPHKDLSDLEQDSNAEDGDQAAAAVNGGGGCADAEAILRADNKRRKRTIGRMPPSSEWRCVALFFNNAVAATYLAATVTFVGAGADSSQGVPVPAAVNSLAWSSLEERLFTADTVGFVKVWDVKGALTSTGDEDEEGIKGPRTSASNDDNTDNGSFGITIATTTGNGDDVGNSSNGGSNTGTFKETDDTDPSGDLTPSTQKLQTSSSAPFDDSRPDDSASISSQGEKRESSVGADAEGLGGSAGTALNAENSDGGRGSSNIANSSAVKRGDSMLWPSEPSESIKGEDYGDKFGRGIGLRFIRRLDEWLPSSEGRQEVIKVKVFEGHGLVFRGVVVDNDRDYRSRRRCRPGGGGRLTKKTKSGTVIIATITPDKLVRFWTSAGLAIGSLDQEYVASPHQKIAARPLASWRMCVVSSEETSMTDGGDTSNRMRGPLPIVVLPAGGGFSSVESTTARGDCQDETSHSSSSCSGLSSTT